MIQMAKAPVPQCIVEWTGACSSRKLRQGHNLAIKEGCIVGVDSCSEQQSAIPAEQELVLFDDDNIGFILSEIQD